MLNLPCKTVQDYPARLHASYCATLQRVGYLARCCTQYVARYLARNIASCRQAFRFGVVPNSITKGLLIPLLKKPSLDQGVPKNYRPVIVSTTFSKLIELYILYECKDFEFSDQQFGFVSGRGTNAAIALAHDIGAYYVSRGSQIYVWARCGRRI